MSGPSDDALYEAAMIQVPESLVGGTPIDKRARLPAGEWEVHWSTRPDFMVLVMRRKPDSPTHSGRGTDDG